MILSVYGLFMSDLYNHCHDDAAKGFWLSNSDKIPTFVTCCQV
jgi:hypothetical protein